MKARRKKKTTPPESHSSAPMPVTPQLTLNATAEAINGKYCNSFRVSHTAREFYFDFILSVDGVNLLASRIYTSPSHAKDIHRVLGENLAIYEKQSTIS